MDNYYEVLQLSPSAEPEVIEAAYRRLAFKYHPDRNREPGSVDRMKLLNRAYEVLSNSARRRLYDEELQAQANPSQSADKHAADATQRGDQHLARRDFAKAIAEYTTAMEVSQNNLSIAYLWLGIRL